MRKLHIENFDQLEPVGGGRGVQDVFLGSSPQ